MICPRTARRYIAANKKQARQVSDAMAVQTSFKSSFEGQAAPFLPCAGFGYCDWADVSVAEHELKGNQC